MSAIKVVETTTLYKNHGKGIGYWKIELIELAATDHEKAGAGGIITHAKGAGCKEVSSSFQSKPKNVGKANETSPLDQARSEVESRINKQLDKGYVRTEEEAKLPATNASGRKMPMLALDIKKVKPEDIDWDTAYCQPKLDGHRCLSSKGLYSRNGKPVNLPHIEQAIKDLGLEHLHLDGELYCHGLPLQEIGSLVKKPREESLQIEYHVYDLVMDLPFVQRHTLLAAALQSPPFRLGAVTSVPIKLVSTVKVDSEEGRQTMHRQYMAQGYEGSMLRHSLGFYMDGKRPNQILKGKDMEDHEYKVVGYEQGAPYVVRDKVTNEVISQLQVPVWVLDVGDGRTFKATAQGTAAEKDKQWAERDSFLGKLLTVRHFGFTPDGIPDLPVAKTWKDDL